MRPVLAARLRRSSLRPPLAESLEPRRLLAASITLAGDGTMIVHGAENVTNKITVYRSTVGSLQFIEGIIEVPGNPQVFTGFNVNQVARVRIDGGSATDTLDVSVSVQKPVTLVDSNASDGDLLRFSGSTGAETVNFGISGNYHLTSGALDINVGNFVERIEILGYEGNDTLRLFGDLFLPITVAGMAGSDTINLDHVHNVYALAFGGYITYPITVDGGGGGTDTLNVNDQAAGRSTYDLPNFTGLARMQSFDLDNGVVGADLRMASFNAVNVNAGGLNDAFSAAVTLPGTPVTFNGNEGNDSLSVGTFFNSINAPITFNGGGGSDSMSLNNSGFNLDCDYEITETYVKYGSIMPLSTVINHSGVESKSFVASPNADNIRIVDLEGPWTIDGSDGSDAISYIGGPTTIPPDRYIITSTSMNYLRRVNPSNGVFFQQNSIFYPNVESYTIYGSGVRNNYEVQSTPSNTSFTIYAGSGDDFLQMGSTTNTVDNVLSPVTFDGQDGTDNAVINDQSDTTGDVLHLDNGGLGHYPEDTLFGPGGRLAFNDLATLTINLGSGADNVFAQPLPFTTVTINGGGPGAAPAVNLRRSPRPLAPAPAIVDVLFLGFAAATDPHFTPGATGAGSYSFANFLPINFSGIESTSIDSVAPTALEGGYEYDAAPPAVTVRFSEDVSPLLTPVQLILVNLTTESTIDPAELTVTYDSATNTARFTRTDGAALPDGNYAATLAAGLTDASTNQMVDNFDFTFFVLAADANHDRTVDFDDLVPLAQNYNTTGGGTFGGGDFNYDGNVDFEDLVILAQRYNTTLAEPPPPMIAKVAAKSRPAAAKKPVFSVIAVTRPAQTKSPRRAASRASAVFRS